MVTRTRGLSRARLLLRVSLIVACGTGSAACAALFGFERLSEGEPEGGTASEASTEAGDAPEPEAGPSCTDLGVPNRPAAGEGGADAGPDAPGTIHMAMRMVDFGIDTTAKADGFNLDRACSPTVTTSTCTTQIDEETFNKYGRDKDDKGLDNAGFELIAYLARLGDAFAPVEINKRLQNGEFGAVIRLADWNGTNEDDSVIVEVFPAIGVWDVDSGAPQAGGKPVFTSSDLWMRDNRFKNVVDTSIFTSANAWVTGGRLVASFQKLTIPVTLPGDLKPVDIILSEAFVSGSLVQDGTSWKLEKTVLGGRWRTLDLLNQVRTIYVKDTAGLKNVYLCDPGVPIYAPVKKQVCDGRDLRSASREDSMNMPCDAVSAGVKIETYAVDMPGPFADLPAAATAMRCEKDGSVPLNDDCDPASP